jgi:hypothetical protein
MKALGGMRSNRLQSTRNANLMVKKSPAMRRLDKLMRFHFNSRLMDKKRLAKEGELRFAAEFIKRGWNLYLPYGEDSPVDLLIQKEGTFKRVQIKATNAKNGTVFCRLKSSNNWQVKKYSKNEIDFFGIYDAANQQGYLIPIEEVTGMTLLTLRLEEPKNHQEKKIHYATDFRYF